MPRGRTAGYQRETLTMAIDAIEMTTIQRTALVMYHLAVLRLRLSTTDVARITGVSDRGALYIMHKISGTSVPLAFVHGEWYLLVEDCET